MTRRTRIERWADANGWTAVRDPAVGWGRRLPGGGRVTLLLHTVGYGRTVAVAQYVHSTVTFGYGLVPVGSGVYLTPTELVVVAVILDASYPRITVRLRSAVPAFGGALARSVSVGHPDFDRLFRVDTDDLATAGSVLGPALIADHLNGEVPNWDLAGNELLAYWPGRLADQTDIPRLAGALLRVAHSMHR